MNFSKLKTLAKYYIIQTILSKKMATKSSPKGNCTGCTKEFTLKTLSENDGMCKRCYNTDLGARTSMPAMSASALAMPNLLSLMTLETVEAKKKEEPKFDEIVKQWYLSKSANGKTQTPKEMIAHDFILALSKTANKDVHKVESLHCLNICKLLDSFVEKLVS